MNVSEESISVERLLDMARNQPDYNHASPILEVIMEHYMGSPFANDIIRKVNEVKASFRKTGVRASASPASPGNMPRVHVGGRPKRAGTPIYKAFIYEGSSRRVQLLCQALKSLGWIAKETELQLFVDLFGGGESVRLRIVWTGEVNALSELFRRLVSERQLVKLPTGLSLWVMVNGHFWENKSRQEFGNNRLRNTHAPKGDSHTINHLVNLLDMTQSMDEIRATLESQR
ncbi:MAG: hypothetical protein IKP30_05180 [Bacteroidaceae bacterium]|nr:hypothetical protein [Bacteroidaceae bacterium]